MSISINIYIYECIYIEGENSADELVCLNLLHLKKILTRSVAQIIWFYFTKKPRKKNKIYLFEENKLYLDQNC